MSKINNQDNDYICLNSLISLNILSENEKILKMQIQNGENSDENNVNYEYYKYSKYLVRIENSDELLAFKICEKPLLEYIDIIESIFYIRDKEECESIYGLKGDKKDNCRISLKENHFLKNDGIKQYTQFYLQHMISGKFISTKKICQNNKLTLTLINGIEDAYTFSFQKINEKRSSSELLTFNQIFYLNIYIKEENQYYYVNEDELEAREIDNSKRYFDIVLHKKAFCKLNIVNQTMMINNKEYIYSGQLINIIFTCNLYGKDEKLMLGVKEDAENNIKNISSESNNYKVVPYFYSENLYEHIIKKAFWVIEENFEEASESIGKESVKINQGIKIKNVSNGLYLNINTSKSFLNENDKYLYEFTLVDKKILKANPFFSCNFKFINYNNNDENKFIINDGKYILKGVCKNSNFQYSKIELYYLPIFLTINNTSISYIHSDSNIDMKNNSILNELMSKEELIIKNDDGFIFNIKKIGISKGYEVIFIHKLILKLDEDLKKQKLNINILNAWITFLIEYLINIEYSFKDNNYESNVPVEERQTLLWEFNVIDIICDIINYFKNNINSMENDEHMKSGLEKLLLNIIRFLLYLSSNQENIKITIYVLLLNHIIEFGQTIMEGDYSKLLFFIFELIQDSEVLQIYLLGFKINLKNYIEKDPYLSKRKKKININHLIKIDKIFEFIETSENFLVLYQKLINLNKIQYKKAEIIYKINDHIKLFKPKESNQIDPNKDNYIKIMKNQINNAKILIKNNVILLDKFINEKVEFKTKKTKIRNSLIGIKYNFNSVLNTKLSLNKETLHNLALGENRTNLNFFETKTKITGTDENISQNQTVKSNQKLINNEADDYIKESLRSNLVSKESEREILLEQESPNLKIRRNSERKNYRNSLRNSIVKSFSKGSSQLVKLLKFDKEKHEDKEKEKHYSKQDYQNILNILGRIWYFIKWYETFDFNYALLIYNNYLKHIFNKEIKDETLENQLFYFLNGNIKSFSFIKDLKINTYSKTGILYLFRLYNTLFPKTYCKYEDKINNNQNLSASDILEDMKENYKLDDEYEKIDDKILFDKNLQEDSKDLDNFLCSFYSSYQFYINQYVKIVHRLFFALSNYFLNSDNFGDLKLISECFKKTLDILLSKVIFLEDDNILVYLYSEAKKNPSLLWGSLDLEEIKNKSIQILSNLKHKNNESNNFFIKQKQVIYYLFSMCQECDQIKYMYEKITIMKYIRNLFFYENISDEEVKKQIKEILELITTKKRLPILKLYGRLNNRNAFELTVKEKNKIGYNYNKYIKSDKSDKWSNYFYEIFRVGQTTNFVTESLRNYEIKELLNNIIFLENKENIIFLDDLIIRKIREIIEKFSDIQNDILMMKVKSISEEGKILESKINNINNKGYNQKLFEILLKHITLIGNDSLECFEKEIDTSSSNTLKKILFMENQSFYEKIHFIDKLNCMIEALHYYKNKKDENILKYISIVLGIVSKIKTMYPNFNKTIYENFELYKTLTLKSLQCISQYPTDHTNIHIELIFLNILYKNIESFLYIIRNCKMNFKKIKDFMEEVFEKMLSIIDKFKTKKNKLLCRILYLFTVCRVLLYLNSEKANDFYLNKSNHQDLGLEKVYDFYSYKSFFNKIFSVKEINKYFFNSINIEENKNEALNDIKRIIPEKDENSEELGNQEETPQKNLNFGFNFNAFPIEKHTYSRLNNQKNNLFNNNDNKINKSEKNISINKSNIEQDSKLEYLNKEIDRLTFFTSFLFVYCLYLNEKNGIVKDNDIANIEKNNLEELSLNILYNKLKSFLNYTNKGIYLSNNNNITNKKQDFVTIDMDSYLNDSPEIIEEKTEIQNDNSIGKKVNKDSRYLFIFSIFQAIVNFQHSSRNKNIEIPIKTKYQKYKEDSSNKSELENESFLTDEKNNSIIFYYYESDYIDIILLEKIINEMYLKSELRNYCLKLSDGQDYIMPDLLNEFFTIQDYYKLISNYYKNEYNLINSLFVQNNMSSLIKKIFSSFNQDDFQEIEPMKFFLYKKLGEIYGQEENIIEDEIEVKNLNLIDYLKNYEEKYSCHFNQINLLTFFDSLIYIYPKYEKNLCLLYYKIGFEILYSKYLSNNNKNKKEKDDDMDLELILKEISDLFNIKSNRMLIEDKYVFNTMILSMTELYRYIIENGAFVLKHFEPIKDFLNSIDFILAHISIDFDKIINFMKRPENLDDFSKFNKKKDKLKIILDFFISLMNLNKTFKEIKLTGKILEFAKKIVERCIKLIFLLIEISNNKSIEIMNKLLDYLFEFIKGPDIGNLNMLFSLGYLNLLSYTIRNIDYYKLFLNYLKKNNIHKIIDNFSIIECKIIKIFIVYYNISYRPDSNIEEFKKLQNWYKINFKYIRKKLKKIFYISEKEMENRQYNIIYDINKMLLFIKDNDNYSEKELYKRAGKSKSDDMINNDDIKKSDEAENKDFRKIDGNKKPNEISNKNNDFCIIKFDLLLSYYTLFNYHKDLSDIEETNALTHIKKKKKNVFYIIIQFFIDLGKFLVNLIIVLIFFTYFLFKRFSDKKKEDADLLQDLTDIDKKCENYDEKKIISFLRKYIRQVEVSIENVIYKVYFPMIDKSNTLSEYRTEYLKVDKIDPSDFTNYLLNNYDYINIRAKQYAIIDKQIEDFPIFNYIFKNMYIYGVLLLVLGVISNFLIMVSFSTFVDDKIGCINYRNAYNATRIQCPHLFYKEKNESKNIRKALHILETIEIILQGLTILDYLIRIFAVESQIVEFNFTIENLKNKSKKTKLKENKCTYILYIAFPTIYRCFFNSQTIYYIISMLFLILGRAFHPFFDCVILLEFVNRIQLMQTILKAMYKPFKNILITLLMFILLEYFFSFFAVSWYTNHFPNDTDTSNFLKTFMRMIDQTFKQDGGIGTYLDKSLDDNFVAYSVPAYFNTRFLFDLFFFIIILLLIFQMFLSTIIDYFNETRENNENFDNNLETQCIVCGIDREEIEKINTNDKNAFKKHIHQYHNIFNYIYYLMYLQSSSYRDPIIDNSVWELHLEKKYSYLPKDICFKLLEKRCWKKYDNNESEEVNYHKN